MTTERQRAYTQRRSQQDVKKAQEDNLTALERRAADLAAYEALKAKRPLKPPGRSR